MVHLPSEDKPSGVDSAATRPIGDGSDTPLIPAPHPETDESEHVFKVGQEVVGRYRVLRYLGRGGMGEVYEVEDGRLNERFALKTLLPELQSDLQYVQRFRREVRTALRVTHPNVCRIHPISDDATFFTMELLSGETLGEFMRVGQSSHDTRLLILRDIIEGLAAIHAGGIVHRDLKPSNVMVIPGAQRVTAKITDFGLARLWVSSDTPITKRGEAQGTLLYMAPELLKGGVASPASDIWALGMVMYELFAGIHPFRHVGNINELQKALFAGEIPAPRTHAPELSAEIETVILRCLSSDQSARYSDLQEILRVLSHQTVAAAAAQTPGAPEGSEDNSAAETISPEFKRILDDADLDVAEGRYADARAKLGDLLESVDPNNIAHIAARLDLAEIQIFQGSDVAGARESLLSCLQGLPRSDQKRRRFALVLLGDAEAHLGNVAAAHSLFLEARQLAHDLRDRFGEAAALVGLSRTEELRGDLVAAERSVEEAIGMFRAEYRDASPDDARPKRVSAVNVAAALMTHAHLLTHAGRLTEALVSVEAALPLFREFGSNDNVGRTLLLKAELLLTEGKWQEGFDLLQEAASVFSTIGNAHWEAKCLRHMARLFDMTGRSDAARAFTAHAVKLLTPEPWAPQERIPYLLDLARLEWQGDAEDEARTHINEAKSLARQEEREGLLADCLLAEASLLHGADNKAARQALFDAAVQDVEAALARTEIRGRRAVYMERLGSLSGYRENVRQARTWFERALREFEAIGDVSGVARCLGAVAGAARMEEIPDEAVSALERVLEFTKTLPLYHERAAALHDLARLRLSHQKGVAAARRCFIEADALVNQYGFPDVRDALKDLSQVLDHAEQVNQPQDRDLGALIVELQRWCVRFPSYRDAIVPLWYFMHRTDLWAISRAMLGVKFLIRCERRDAFDTAAGALFTQGDLFVFGLSFVLRKQRRTELIPCDMDALYPAHLLIGVLEKNFDDADTALDPQAVAQAYVNALSDEPYIMVPFDESVEGAKLQVLGRHLRLPQAVLDVMLAPSVIDEKKVCLPLGGGRVSLDPDLVEEDAPDLHHVMLVALENGFIPLFLEKLPPAGEVKVVASTPVTLRRLSKEQAVAAKKEWARLLAECQSRPREALANFRDTWIDVVGASDAEPTISSVAYALRFQAGSSETTYPALVLRL